MPRSDFVQILRDIAARHGLDIVTLSHDWIIQIRDTRSSSMCNVFGYTFDVNPAGAVDICREKAATALVLKANGVPCIPHDVFLNPAASQTENYVPVSGNWTSLQAKVTDWHFPIVVKPLKGTGGLGVMKARCWRELERSVQKLFAEEYGICVSPYKEIRDEYRCICFDGTVQAIFRKIRSGVVGDGTKTVMELASDQLVDLGKQNRVDAYAALISAIGTLSANELSTVPGNGVTQTLQWKHNLGQGATVSMQVDSAMRNKVSDLAVRAAQAVGMRFCSVDVVDVIGEGLLTMEVNSGVMMDSFIGQLGSEGKRLAFDIYERAVLNALQMGRVS